MSSAAQPISCAPRSINISRLRPIQPQGHDGLGRQRQAQFAAGLDGQNLTRDRTGARLLIQSRELHSSRDERQLHYGLSGCFGWVEKPEDERLARLGFLQTAQNGVWPANR